MSALASPARCEDLSGLPPAWIGVGTLDLFYEEDRAYADRLSAAGVEREVHVVVHGAFHGFDINLPMSIGSLFHIIHMTRDVAGLEAWYDDVFSVQEFLPHTYSPHAQRDASLVVIGDTVIEPLAPAFRIPGWETAPLGRFFQHFGSHWHSIAWYTDDAGEIWQRCVDAGVRVMTGGGKPSETRPEANGIIMTHPRDTVTRFAVRRSGNPSCAA